MPDNRVSPELLDRLPPHDLQAERATVGSPLLDDRLIDDVALILRPEDFYADANQKLYAHMLAMHDAGGRIDVVLLSERLKRAGDYEAIGGAAYLAEVMTSTPVAGNAVYYAKIVATKAAYRKAIYAASDILRDAYAEDGDPEQLVDRAEQALHGAWTGENHRAPKLVDDAIVDVIAAADATRDGSRPAGLMTGLETFDRNIGGLFPGELIVVAARPGLGKTALACQIAHHTAAHGRPVYLASLEMTAAQLMARVLCGQADVNSRRLRTGLIDQTEIDRLVEASHAIAGGKWWIHDAPQMTCAEIRRTARRLHRDGLSLIIVDYLQRITPRDRRVNRDQQVGEMSTDLKSLAMELEVPILCLCQLNRQIEQGGAPRLSHLRESGSIEQDADVVAFLHRDGKEAPDAREPIAVDLHVLKNRNGETGLIPLDWIPARTMFRCREAWV